MKKVERLQYIEREWGPEWVLPYRACSTWEEIRQAIQTLRAAVGWIGMRTDWPGGPSQGTNLPFVYHVNEEKAREIWDEHGDRLSYIVCGGVSPVDNLANVMAERRSRSLLLVEWDDGGCAQRDWEHVCMPLHHAYVDRWNSWQAPHPIPSWPPLTVRVRPVWAMPPQLRLSELYDRLVAAKEDETVWTVCRDGRIVIW